MVNERSPRAPERCHCVACSRSSSGLWLGMAGCAALMVLAAALGLS